MKSLLRTLLGILFMVGMTIPTAAQTTGDYRSAASGVWSAIGTWETYNGSAWVAAATKPGSTVNVTIQNGHSVTLGATESVKNLTIDAGGTLNGDVAATIASPRTFRVNGTSVIVNGTLGSVSGGSVNLECNVASSTMTISGTGTVNISRIRPNQTGVTHVFDIDIKVNYAGSGGTGGTGLQGNKDGTIYTINAGKTLSFGTSSSLSTGTGTSATANGTTLNVYGTIDLLSNNGYLALKNTTGITSALNIYSGGEVKTGGNCSLTNGTDAGTISLTVNGALSCNGTLDLGVATVSGTGSITNTVSLNAPSSVNVGGLGAVITSAGNLGSTTVKRGFSFQTGSGNQGIKRWYDIAPATNTGLNATLVFNYSEGDELNGIEETNLVPFKSTDGGTTWTLQTGTLDVALNTVTISGIDGFSRWTLGNVNSKLPVELTGFTAQVKDRTVELLWNTKSEVNNAGFSIERRISSGTWSSIGFAEGNGTVNTPRSYRFTDHVSSARTYQYRLKQIDRDGAFEYSPVVEAVVGLTARDYQLSQNYPNPFNPSTVMTFAMNNSEHVSVKVFNLLGQEVATLFNDIALGNQLYTLTFDASRLSSGIYLYTLRSNSRTETRKMLFNK